jgi:hypothetical protein
VFHVFGAAAERGNNDTTKTNTERKLKTTNRDHPLRVRFYIFFSANEKNQQSENEQ